MTTSDHILTWRDKTTGHARCSCGHWKRVEPEIKRRAEVRAEWQEHFEAAVAADRPRGESIHVGCRVRVTGTGQIGVVEVHRPGDETARVRLDGLRESLMLQPFRVTELEIL